MNVNKSVLKLAGFVLLALLVFGSCDNPASSTPSGGSGDYNDNPVASFAYTVWTDRINPLSTIEFTTSSQVTLNGRYWAQPVVHNQPSLEGTYTFEQRDSLSGNAVEPAVIIFTNAEKQIGMELYYYKAAGTKHQRLVVYCTGFQPREFYLR
jgi:hypothetical protein